MVRLVKVFFWIAVVVMFLPEDISTNGNNDQTLTAGAIELASKSINDISGFCVRNPDACLQGKDAINGIGKKAINSARSIYDYLQETSPSNGNNGLEQVLTKADLLSIEEQIKIAQSKGQTLSVADLNINLETIQTQ